jgi:hypothetical protein
VCYRVACVSLCLHVCAGADSPITVSVSCSASTWTPGTFTLKLKASQGEGSCQDNKEAEATITVYQKPALTLTPTPATVCAQGGNAELSFTVQTSLAGTINLTPSFTSASCSLNPGTLPDNPAGELKQQCAAAGGQQAGAAGWNSLSVLTEPLSMMLMPAYYMLIYPCVSLQAATVCVCACAHPCLPACLCVLRAGAGVEYTVDVTCFPPAGGFPVSGFSVSLQARQDTTGLLAGSCSDSKTEVLAVTVTPKPTLTITKLTHTDLCESATGLQQVATFQVTSDVTDSDISLEVEGEPEGVTCTTDPASPVSGERVVPVHHSHLRTPVGPQSPAVAGSPAAVTAHTPASSKPHDTAQLVAVHALFWCREARVSLCLMSACVWGCFDVQARPSPCL